MIGRWFAGFVVFVGYLCLGAFVFYRIERKEEEKRHYQEIVERLELKDLLAKHYTQVNAHVHRQFVQQLNTYCNRTVLDESPDEIVHQYQWTYYNAFFFALTTLSTIGYGNLHPTSATGRILVLVYSLIGIPLNGIVLTQLGSFFESRILRAHYSYKTQRMMGPQLSLIVDIITYLIPGIIVFIFIPSGIISYFEQWTFDESVYFAFVTLTTIGYGDYVAGQTVNTNIWYNAYKVFLVFWIMFGLGYLFMILSFISRAMRSKTLEHLFLERLKHTHSKIWHQFTKDVVYIRRILNESYLLKFKPVYKKEASSRDQPLLRSRSAPNLTEWPVMRKTVQRAPADEEEEDEETVRRRFEKHRMKRRRALSQNKMRSLLRRTKATSEIDLAHIDKEATFGADIASYEILSRVVDALETAVPNQPPVAAAHHHHHHHNHHHNHVQQQPSAHLLQDAAVPNNKNPFSYSEGVHGFSSEDILACEKNEMTVGGDMLNRENTFGAKHRHSYFEYDTWGGADDRHFKKFNEYAKRGDGGYHQQPKPRVPRLRRMSAAAFNFLSNNIAPKWLTDKLADGGGGGGGGGAEWTDDPRHRLSLNDEYHGHGYGSTHHGGAVNHGYANARGGTRLNPRHASQRHSYANGGPALGCSRPVSFGLQPVHHQQHHQQHHLQHHHHQQQHVASSAPEHPRQRRLSSPDPVLAHCANTIAVADFLMTLQRSLDKSSATLQPSSAVYPDRLAGRAERRSPLFTLFQDRRASSSAESWQYSSLASTVSSSTVAPAAGPAGAPADRLPPAPAPLLLPAVVATVGQVQSPAASSDGCENVPLQQQTAVRKSKKKRIRRFSIRPTACTATVAPEQLIEPDRCGWTTGGGGGKNCDRDDVRLDIED